jgi:uncharacterized protein
MPPERRAGTSKAPGQIARLEGLTHSVTIVAEPAERPLPEGIDLPARDRPILLAAIDARATHLLSGDRRHFGPYYRRRVEGVLILPPAEYPAAEPE